MREVFRNKKDTNLQKVEIMSKQGKRGGTINSDELNIEY